MSYKKAVIYFMSGTGNSYRAASWIGKNASGKGISAAVKTIEKADPEKEIEDSSTCILGLVMPTHAFTAPWHMIRFAMRLPRRSSVNAFCVSTRAGMNFGSVFTPGMSASSNFVMSAILRIKGYKVLGILPLDMPSNWIACHTGLPEKNVRAIIDRGEKKIKIFTDKILSGEKVWFNTDNLYDILCAIPLFPVSLLFLLIGRFFLAKLFFANNKCTGCGICTENCPVEAIKMRGRKKKLPYWSYNCENCMRCMAFCPEKAVEAGHSWAIILYLIISVPVSIYLLSFLNGLIPETSVLREEWAGNIINFIYIYPAVFISYFLFSLIMRVPVINSLFTCTTLTHYYRRYKEPGTALKDISPGRK